ncbi:hypothetical protein FAI41_01730 [Acetobacteraceae bacterium]|nr:hypothetical protein FAI41_01730 [Acetobacteraceae bacterium]
MYLITLFLNIWREKIFFSFQNLLCACLIGIIFLSNLCLSCHLPKHLDLLGLENHSNYFSPTLFCLSNIALFSLCGFCLSFKKPFNFLLLSVFSAFSLYLGIKSFFPLQENDLSFLQAHLTFFGHTLPTQFYIFSLYLLGTLLIIGIFLPFTTPEVPTKKRFLSLPFLMLFVTLMAAQSYRFRHVEINSFLTQKTGLIASFAGKNGGLRFLYPHPYQDIAQWKTLPNANLQTEHSGERTALLVRREFPGLIGESLGFIFIQLSTPNKILSFEKTF